MPGHFELAPAQVAPRYAKQFSTDANGQWSGQVPAGMLYTVQPMTTGEFNNSCSLAGTTCTVAFRKFKTSGLGITLGTLLTVSAFEDASGIVVFNLTGETIT